ncbi:MAG: SusC/RagA family TonB-linked outer membrane protein, partial [Bacteroidetes bacterium]|nr:SusC/RagA family TonB-linked outer membrane protein [Bacteroidota bacterium]
MVPTSCCKEFSTKRLPWGKPAITFLLVVFFATSSTIGLSQNVRLKATNASLKSVFTQIKKQTGYSFFYNPDLLNLTNRITIDVKEMPLEKALDLLFKDQPLTYTMVGKLITLSVRRPGESRGAMFLQSPFVKITGQVRNKLGQPLEGASVMILHKNSGALTNSKGEFVLEKVRREDTLDISMIGYRTGQMTVPATGYLEVVLKDAVDKLDEVLKTAYGRTSRRLATGDIVKVTSEEIEKQPVSNPLLALQGRVPGLVITPISGYASSPVKVELRGRSDLNPSSTGEPLYVVDGVPLTVLEVSGGSGYAFGGLGLNQGVPGFTNGQSPLFSINPKDIESIEVLKDAGATAIYGSRGAKGVILITTKKGQPGPAQFNLGVEQGISTITRYWQMLNTSDYLRMRREAFRNDAITPSALTAPDLLVWDTTRYTDWQRTAFGGTGKFTQVSASLSGGSGQTTFSLRGGYFRVSDITVASGATQRATLNSSIGYHSADRKLDVLYSSNLAYNDINVVGIPSGPNASALPPNAPPIFSKTGALNWDGWNQGMSPYFPLINFPFGALQQRTPASTINLNSDLVLKYRILDNLVFSTRLGYNGAHTTANSFTPITAQNPLFKPTGQAYFGATDNSTWLVEPQLDYTVIVGPGKLSILTGGTFQSTATHVKRQLGYGYTSDLLLGSILTAPNVTNYDAEGFQKILGMYGIINYNLYDRYILELNARRDGSSRFGPGRQFGNFGSAAFAWIASEEKWLKKALPSWTNFLKLRGSYGITGSDGVDDYQYISQWSSASSSLSGLPAYDGVSPLVSIHAVNPLFQWQVNKKLEGSLELGLFEGNRVNLTATYYRERTGNQLVPFTTPILTGFPSVTANFPAVVQNSGWEALLHATIIQTKALSWSVDFNISINRNRLLAFPNLASSPYATLYKVGAPTAVSFAFHYTGVDPLTGRYTYQDVNHDGKITYDP